MGIKVFFRIRLKFLREFSSGTSCCVFCFNLCPSHSELLTALRMYQILGCSQIFSSLSPLSLAGQCVFCNAPESSEGLTSPHSPSPALPRFSDGKRLITLSPLGAARENTEFYLHCISRDVPRAERTNSITSI